MVVSEALYFIKRCDQLKTHFSWVILPEISVLVTTDADGPLPTRVDAAITNIYRACSSKSTTTSSLVSGVLNY